MTFFRTEMLFLIWAVPMVFLVILYGMRRRRDIMRRFSSDHGLAAIVPDRVDGRRWVKGSLLTAAVLFGVLALAGPKVGYRWQEIHQRGVDLIIALDCSRSMAAADTQPNRLERAKREVFDLLAMLQGDRVGLVAFAGTAFLQCPLTLDYDAFHLFINALSPDYLPVGGTDLNAALQTAMDGFDPKSASDKAVILITDGEHTGSGDPIKMAQTLRENGIKLFSIGVGGNDGVPIPEPDGGFKKDAADRIVLSRLDETTLDKMAGLSGGSYVRSVAGDMDLEAIYTTQIRGKMDAATLTSGRRQVWEDRFQWPLALAVICLAAELMLPTARKAVIAALLAGMMILPAQSAGANDTREGIAAYEQGNFDQALQHFIDAQLKAPENPDILYNVADAYYKTGQFDAAVDHFRQVLETDDTRLRHDALYNLGNAEFRRGNAEAAIGHYEAALAIDPDDRLSRENLAFVKKALERQQRQQSGQKGDQKENPNQKEDPGSAEQPATDRSSPDQAPPSPDAQRPEGSRDPQEHGDDGEQQVPAFGDEMSPQQQQAAPPESTQGDPMAATSPQTQAGPADRQTGRPDQAEHMLNRLQDQPGRALMPATGRRPVEKDW